MSFDIIFKDEFIYNLNFKHIHITDLVSGALFTLSFCQDTAFIYFYDSSFLCTSLSADREIIDYIFTTDDTPEIIFERFKQYMIDSLNHPPCPDLSISAVSDISEVGASSFNEEELEALLLMINTEIDSNGTPDQFFKLSLLQSIQRKLRNINDLPHFNRNYDLDFLDGSDDFDNYDDDDIPQAFLV